MKFKGYIAGLQKAGVSLTSLTAAGEAPINVAKRIGNTRAIEALAHLGVEL